MQNRKSHNRDNNLTLIAGIGVYGVHVQITGTIVAVSVRVAWTDIHEANI